MVVTNDNPRSEAPMAIISDILSGLSRQEKSQVIVNREQAVLTTLSNAKQGDVVLLAGKGHENYILLGKDKVDYNERQVVQAFFTQVDANSVDKTLGANS